MSKDKPEGAVKDVRHGLEHGEWFWFRVTGPDGLCWLLGKPHWMSADCLMVLVPDDACTDHELEPDGRLHKWHVVGWEPVVPPVESGADWLR